MKKILIVSLAALTLAACGKGRSANPAANAREAAKDNDLQTGSWQSECIATPVQALAEKVEGIVAPGPSAATNSERIEYKFKGENVTRSLFRYEQVGCVGDAVTYTENGTFKIETNRNKDTNDKGRNIDMTFTNVMASVKGAGLTLATTNALCGAKDWTEGKERDVTDVSGKADCYPVTYPPDHKRTVFNVYRITPEDGGKLHLGADPNGPLDANARPKTVLTGPVFKSKK